MDHSRYDPSSNNTLLRDNNLLQWLTELTLLLLLLHIFHYFALLLLLKECPSITISVYYQQYNAATARWKRRTGQGRGQGAQSTYALCVCVNFQYLRSPTWKLSEPCHLGGFMRSLTRYGYLVLLGEGIQE